MAKIEGYATRAICALAIVFGVTLFLSACAPLRENFGGEIVGASVTLGGFTVGLSGKFPTEKP